MGLRRYTGRRLFRFGCGRGARPLGSRLVREVRLLKDGLLVGEGHIVKGRRLFHGCALPRRRPFRRCSGCRPFCRRGRTGGCDCDDALLELLFEGIQPHDERIRRKIVRGQRDAQNGGLEAHARRGDEAHVRLGLCKHLGGAQERPAVRPVRGLLERRKLLLGEREELFRRAARLGDGKAVELGHQVLQKHPHRLARRKDALRALERRGHIRLDERLGKGERLGKVRRPQHLGNALVGELVLIGDAHLGDGEHVSVRARSRTRDGGDRLLLVRFAHAVEDALQVRFEVLLGNELEVEAHAPREDGRGDLVRLGGRQDEDGVGGRLLERL